MKNQPLTEVSNCHGAFVNYRISGAGDCWAQCQFCNKPCFPVEPKNKAAQSLGSLGGRAGKGAAKRRSAEHYKRMVTARAEKRKRDKEAQIMRSLYAALMKRGPDRTDCPPLWGH